MAPVAAYVGARLWDEISIEVYPSEAQSTFTLYEDDGTTLDYQKGEYSTVRLTCHAENGTITLGLDAHKGKHFASIQHVRFNVHGIEGMPRQVREGRKLLPRATEDGIENWGYEESRRIAWVKAAFGRRKTIRIMQ